MTKNNDIKIFDKVFYTMSSSHSREPYVQIEFRIWGC